MPAASFVQTNFLGGEWAAMAQGQMAHPRYGTALARCSNVIPIEEACAVRRPGFRQLYPTRNGAYGRLLEFAFADRSPYNLEFTDSKIRMFAGKRIVTDLTMEVTSISAASPAVVTVPDTGLATDEQVIFEFRTDTHRSTCSALANRVFKLASLTSTTFQLLDPLTDGVDFNGSLLTASAAGILIHRIKEITSPYTEEQIPNLRIVQKQETAILLHGSVSPRTLLLTTEPTDTFAEFELSETQFLDGPYMDPATGSTATPSGTTGHITVTLGFAAYSATKAYKKGDYVTSASIGYRSLTGNNLNKTPASNVGTYWEVASPGEVVGPDGFTSADVGRSMRLHSNNASWTWGRITAISTTGVISGTLAGSTNIGDMTGGGGLAAAFDGTVNAEASAAQSAAGVLGCYVGKNYTTPGAQTISSCVVSPPSGMNFEVFSGGAFSAFGGNTATVLTFKLRAKATAPSSRSDGTLLGTATASSLSNTPVVIVSNNTATTWNYVWVEVVCSYYENVVFGEVQFYSATAIAGTAVTVEVLGPDLVNTSVINTWRLGLYGGANGYPTCGCYAHGRLWLGGVIPGRFDASKSNDVFNFEPTAAAGTVADNNAIAVLSNSAKSMEPYWMKPGLSGIVVGTDGGEFLIKRASDSAGLTPTNTELVLVSKYKCANVEPEETPSTVLFVQKHKRKLQEYMADPQQSGKFFAPNMSKFAKHLATKGLEELCYQEELTPIVWARDGEGSLRGCTYRRTSLYSAEDPEFFGWHQHEHGAERTFVSLCAGPSEDDATDTLYAITKQNTGIHYVEFLTKIATDDSVLTDAQYLDAALVPGGAITYVSGDERGLIIGGLGEHRNKRVTAWIGGIDCGEFTVINSTITVPYGSDEEGLLTYEYIHNLHTSGTDFGDLAVTIDSGMLSIPMVIGYTYSSEGQLLPPVAPERAGAANGPAFAKRQRGHGYGILLKNSQGVEIGTDFEHQIKPCLFRKKNQSAYAKNELFSGVHEDTLSDNYSFQSKLCWRTNRPYPTNVLALGGFIHTQDR